MKQRASLMLLHLVNSWFSGISSTYNKIKGDTNLTTVLYYPEITDIDVLSDVANRASWYFPRSELAEIKVLIAVSSALAGTDTRLLSPPDCEENYVEYPSSVKLTDRINHYIREADAVMVWDKTALFDLQLVPKWHKVHIVDPTFYSYVESHTHRTIFARGLLSHKSERLLKKSRDTFERLINKVSGREKGYVFGSGPSIEKAGDHNFDDGFTVICNSLVKNRKLLSHISPDLLVFADPVFHFSPSRYSAEFRRQMLEVVREFGCFVMIPDVNLPLMLSHFPELNEVIIGMPSESSTYNFPTMENFSVKSTDNIMTFLMLPVASSVSKEIYLLGSDGRAPGDNYFWKHSETVQFEDLMDTAFRTHPSFFRDRHYAGYYNRHCKVFMEMLKYGENLGKKYYSLSPSYIPSLKERPVPRG